MLTSAPSIPHNLKKKLEAAVNRFQREYDHLTLADARRLLARHDYRVPVLGALQFHGNGVLKEVSLRENLKRLKPSGRWIAADLTIFGYPVEGRRQLWNPFIRWIVAEQVKRCREDGWYQTDKLTNGELDALLRQLQQCEYAGLDIRAASLLMLRMMAEIERDARKDESNHQALQRLARALPEAFVDVISREKEDALRWLNEMTERGYPPFLGYRDDFLSEEDRIVMSYRDYQVPH